MPIDGRSQAFVLVALIVAITIVGLCVIVGLTWAFRRGHRQQKRARKRPRAYVDAWRESGRRAAPIDTTQPPEGDDER